MQKKILFLDLDGTLLNDQHEISAGNLDALNRALAAGHQVVVTTGRPLISGLEQGKRRFQDHRRSLGNRRLVYHGRRSICPLLSDHQRNVLRPLHRDGALHSDCRLYSL